MPRLIDADALYDIVMDSIKPMTKNEAIILQDFIALIEDAPTVDAVPTDFHDKCMELEIKKRMDLELNSEPVRHGHWIITPYGHMTCSSCEWLFEYYGGLEEEWNICPHCGAKMDKDSNYS